MKFNHIYKTALLLSGKPSEYKECFNRLNNAIIEGVRPDIYIYATCNKEEKSKLEELYNPKRIETEKKDQKSINLKICKKAEETNIESVLQMTRKIYLCYKLIKENYDWIIKCRFDCIINNLVINENFLRSLDKNALHIPVGGDFRKGIHDVLCIGPEDLMKHYCSLYQNIPHYIENRILFHPETLLGHHLKNIKIDRFDCEVLLRKFYKQTGLTK